MSLNRQDARRDENEPEIVAALELAGCRVKRGNWVDLIAQRGSQTFLIEVKTQRGRLTGLQRALIAQGWKIHVVRTVTEALQAVGLLPKEAA